MIKTNYHTHTYLCGHAEGSVFDYVDAAVKLGYTEVGISDHAPFRDLDFRMSFDEYKNIYLPDLEKSIKIYENDIKIYKGLEIEYFEGYDDYYISLLKEIDYLVLGQHYVVDLGHLISSYALYNENLINQYKDTVIKAMRTGYFKILAHPELFLYHLTDFTPFMEKISRDIIEAAIAEGVFLEINVNGMRRKKILNQDKELVYIYPRIEFWKIVKDYPEAKIIINEDIHDYKLMDDDVCSQAHQLAKDLGLNVSKFIFK